MLDDSKIRLIQFRQNLIGHNVRCVTTVRETIDSLADEDWDYLFLDHDLGGQVNVPSGPGTGYEVAQWLVEHPDRQPEHIVLHSFNENGRKNMQSLLPEAMMCPGAWTKIR